MTKFGWNWLAALVITILACGVIVQHGMILNMRNVITDLDDSYRSERAYADYAIIQAAKCINARKRYVNVGGYGEH